MSSNSFPITIQVTEDVSENFNIASLPYRGYYSLIDPYNAKLKLGVYDTYVQCSLNYTADCVIVSKNLADKTSLYSGLRTNLLIKDNTLSIGPLIGSFTDTTSVRKASEQRPGNKLSNLCNANKDSQVMIYFFSIDDYIVEDGKINGTFYNNVTERWEKRLFPLPDVLYDRGGGILKSQIPATEYIRQSIESNENVKRFNPKYYFDKLDVHNKLMRYPEINNHLPYTIPYKRPQDLSEMFEEFPTLYIKDRVGNRGLGVSRITKYPNGYYELTYFIKEFFKYSFDSFEELVKKLEELYKNKIAILQGAIDVIKLNGGNVDMRATVQRDGMGTLGITACPVRVGRAGLPITTTKSGSDVYTFEDFFKNLLTYSDEEINLLSAKVNKFLLTTYMCIEDSYGTFGELGIDFALDKDNNIWFIECNAKPGKDTVYLSYDETTVKKAFLNPLEYSKYLCGF